ncbi:hypothetical protein ACU4GD_19390 [Cupriavidus basilensis]
MTARRQHHVSHLSVETFVATTGSALNWVCEKLRWFESAKQISALAARSRFGARRDVPACVLTGLRVPQMQPEARKASLTGVSIASSQAEVAYAILAEGIAHAVASCASRPTRKSLA